MHRASFASSDFTQDTDDVADTLIADVLGGAPGGVAWLPLPSTPASEDLQNAAAQLASRSVEANSLVVELSDNDDSTLQSPAWYFEADLAHPGVTFNDDTLIGACSSPEIAGPCMMAWHSPAAGIVECDGAKPLDSLRSSGFMPAFSPLPVTSASTDFTFPCLAAGAHASPQLAACKSPEQASVASKDAYGTFARFLSNACYATPLPGQRNEAAAGSTQESQAVQSPRKGKPVALTPDLWQAHHAAQTPDAQGNAATRTDLDAGFSFGVTQSGLPATPRFGGAASTQASPSIFQAAGLQGDTEQPTPMAFAGPMQSSQQAAVASPSNPFAALCKQRQRQSDNIASLADARARIQAMQDELRGKPHVSECARAPPVDVPPPGTPPFARLMRHLSGNKQQPTQQQNKPEAQASSTTACNMPAAGADNGKASQALLAQSNAGSKHVTQQCVPRPADNLAAAAPSASPPSVGWLPFASLVRNIVGKRYESPMVPVSAAHKSPAPPATEASSPKLTAQADASAANASCTPTATLLCPLSDRNSVSGDKSSGERSTGAKRIHSLHFSGATDTNDCSPVSGIARSSFTGMRAHSPASHGDENSPQQPPPGTCETERDSVGGGSPLMSALASAPSVRAAFSSPVSAAASSSDASPLLRVHLEPAVTEDGEHFVLLHIRPRHEAWLPSSEDSPATRLTGYRSASPTDISQARAELRFAQQAEQQVDAAAALRMSDVSDIVITGDITPRDGEANNVDTEYEACTVSSCEQQVEGEETNVHGSAVGGVQGVGARRSTSAEQPCSPQLCTEDTLPALRRSASPDTAGAKSHADLWLDLQVAAIC